MERDCPSPISSGQFTFSNPTDTPLRLQSSAGRLRKQSIPQRAVRPLPADYRLEMRMQRGHLLTAEPMPLNAAGRQLMHRYGFDPQLLLPEEVGRQKQKSRSAEVLLPVGVKSKSTRTGEALKRLEMNNSRRGNPLRLPPPSSAGNSGSSPGEDDDQGPSASNPNVKPTIVHGHHLPEDLDPECQALHAQWYSELYRNRRSPSALAALGQVRTAGFGGTPLDISGSPGHSLLQQPEFDLCCLLRLQPLQYFQSRHTLLLNLRTRGFFRKSAAQKMLHIDVNKTGRLYDFFVKMRWIPEDEAGMSQIETPASVDWRRLE